MNLRMKAQLSRKIWLFSFMKLQRFAKNEHISDYCLTLTQDSQSESGKSLKLREKSDPKEIVQFQKEI